MAQGATEAVGIAGDGLERRPLSHRDPTMGAKVITPELDRKIRKALAREVRLIDLSLKCHLALLYLSKLFLEARSALLHVVEYLYRSGFELRGNRHD